MPKISLTTFVDFVIASGTPRITCVRNAKAIYGESYNPSVDYWRELREGIINMHETESVKNTLDQVLPSISSQKRLNYKLSIESYKSWMGRKKFLWIGTITSNWSSNNTEVRVNPELGLNINGTDHVIKIYFRKDPPSKLRLDTIFHLISSTRTARYKRATPGLLDVKRGRLITSTVSVPNIGALLDGEAAAFSAMWDSI